MTASLHVLIDPETHTLLADETRLHPKSWEKRLTELFEGAAV
jgi:hypothetical protein